MKTCHNCHVHSICPELDPLFDASGEEVEFCSDYCREAWIDQCNPVTVLAYWVDGDLKLYRKTEDDALLWLKNYMTCDYYKDFDFHAEAKRCGLSEANPSDVLDLINALNHFNSRNNNPVAFYFVEMD